MVIKSYLKLRGKDDRWRFDKMGGGFFSVIRYHKPLVVHVCQLPSVAIARFQYRSTVISLYNMLKISFSGSVVLPTKSGNKVSVRYLPLLKNMDEVDKYAWGASQLVHLHKSLSDCKKKTTTSIAGHTYSLLLALHLTGATLEEHIANLPKSFPLLVGWAKLLEKSANNAWKAKDKAEFKNTLNRIYEGMEGDDEMDEEDGCKIVWQPYKRLGPLDQFLPPYCIGQQKMGMSRTVLICFERFAYHRPDISPKQFGLKESCLHRPLVELGRLKRWNGRIKDLGKDEMHNTYKQEWDARNDCLICPPDYSTTDAMLPFIHVHNMIHNALAPVRQRLNNLLGKFNALVVRFDDGMKKIRLLKPDASRIGHLETDVRRLFGKYNSLRDDFEARSNPEAGRMG
ncbi:hypothetical protein Vadar_029955 [Vaccinium darrowii]|uniref:Uncharacterized protein n=1 Tax=Vaccinium darrowii TaxID=229202 RepID=A0ACB7YB05_9ERIC|nr:hypothetical protein Vadar_029955 [Vaccinium darrowii]